MQAKTRLQQVSVKLYLAEQAFNTWLSKKAPRIATRLAGLDRWLHSRISPYAHLNDDLRQLHPAIPLALAGVVMVLLIWLLF